MTVKKIFPFFFLILGFGLLIRLIFLNQLGEIESNFNQPLILQLLSFALPISVYLFILLSVVNGYLFYLLGKRTSKFLGLILMLLYGLSPWFIYADLSGSIYGLAITGVLLTFLGYLERDKLNGYRLLVGGGIFLSYLFLFGFLYYIFLLYLAYFKEKKRLINGLIPLVPLICLVIYNPVGLKNIMTAEITLFSDIGIINAVNTFQGNLYEAGWGGFGKLILNKFSYYFLLIIDSLLRVISPVTYFTAERKMFDFSNLIPLSFILLLPIIFGIKKLLKNFDRKLLAGFLGCFLLMLPGLLSDESAQLEKLLLISPLLLFVTGNGVYELYLRKQNVILFMVGVVFLITLLLTFTDFLMYEKVRLELFKR